MSDTRRIKIVGYLDLEPNDSAYANPIFKIREELRYEIDLTDLEDLTITDVEADE